MIRLFGDDYITLRAYAEEVKNQIKAQPGTINVTDSLTESVPLTRVSLDTDRALRVGLVAGQVGSTLRWLYGQDKLGEFRQGEEQVQLLLAPQAVADPLKDVEGTLIIGASGQSVPLREVGHVELKHGFAELKRRNGRRVVEITADMASGVLPASVLQKLDPWLQAKSWEPGYGFTYAGAQEETDKSFKKLTLAAMGTMLMIFFPAHPDVRQLRAGAGQCPGRSLCLDRRPKWTRLDREPVWFHGLSWLHRAHRSVCEP